jgi:hypothetical protein
MDTLHEDVCTFMIISRRILLRMGNVLDTFVGKLKTHILCSVIFFFENRAFFFFEIISKNVVQPEKPQMTVWRMRVACSVRNATQAHELRCTHMQKYVIIIANPQTRPVLRLCVYCQPCNNDFRHSQTSDSFQICWPARNCTSILHVFMVCYVIIP